MADQLGWASTYDAEYVELARSVEGIVATATIDALRSSVSERLSGE